MKLYDNYSSIRQKSIATPHTSHLQRHNSQPSYATVNNTHPGNNNTSENRSENYSYTEATFVNLSLVDILEFVKAPVESLINSVSIVLKTMKIRMGNIVLVALTRDQRWSIMNRVIKAVISHSFGQQDPISADSHEITIDACLLGQVPGGVRNGSHRRIVIVIQQSAYYMELYSTVCCSCLVTEQPEIQHLYFGKDSTVLPLLCLIQIPMSCQ